MEKKIKKQLKAQSHHLDPVVRLGVNGLTDAVHEEIDLALNSHELIKIKLSSQEKADRQSWTQDILQKHQAELINEIGHLICIYRKNDKN